MSDVTAKALDGITVIDLTRYLPGPYCTRLLANFGATVIKVEAPGGDPVRAVGWYELLNAGKRIVPLDLRDKNAPHELDKLLAGADVCVEGFRPSTAKALGVDSVALRARHPRLVHCSISGYGQTGPDAERAAHDLNHQGEAGLLGNPPAAPPLLTADVTAAFQAALGILAALYERGSTGRGAFVDVSLAAAAASWTALVPPAILRGDHACYNVYEAADGQWLALGALERKFWERFCVHVGKPEWASMQFEGDPVRSRLLHDVRALVRSRDRDAWLRDFADVDCCLSPIAKM